MNDCRTVRVLPDVPAIDKTFDYLVPGNLGGQVRVGSVVRVELHGRRVGGWVVADGVEPPPGLNLLPLAKVTGWGPPPELIELASWAAWRWAGRPASFLGTATADRAVTRLPTAAARPPEASVPGLPEVQAAARDAVGSVTGGGVATLRLPPTVDMLPVVVEGAARGDTLVLAPSVVAAKHLGMRLRRAGLPTAILPNDWPLARAGCSVVVGARAAAWAPVRDLSTVFVLDEHDEAYQEERSPTWHARDVAIERAARAGAGCVLVSPAPTLEALGAGRLFTTSRGFERSGWPVIDVVDMRHEDPAKGLLTDRVTSALRSGARVVCVLNRKGRSRLLACATCRELARCERCESSVTQDDAGLFVCMRCGQTRPAVCEKCGSTKFKNLRVGVSRLREELEALAETSVVDVTGERSAGDGDARVYVGTEAVLHHLRHADVVAYLDFDQELLAPRYRAAEQALSLLVRGARLVGGRETSSSSARSMGGRLLVQTRLPQHEVVQAALLGDAARVAAAENERRTALGFPPVTAMAAVSGAAAEAFIDSFGAPLGVEVLGPSDGMWLLRAPDHRTLCDALAAAARPPGRLRVEVDPRRI